MRIFLFLALTSYVVSYVQGRILFPEEVVSFLSFIYSIIPPFKIGKDSRFGAGFRVGPNADFQVLVELGPQSETQPLGPDATISTRQARANRMAKQKQGNSTLRRTKVKKKKIKSNRSNKNTTRQETKPKQKIE